MSVHYKFKSALEYDTVTFDGLHISVRDLKKSIAHQKRIGKNTDFDLQVTNAQTKEVYTDEDALIPKNTSLLIARIPMAAQTKSKTWEGYGGNNTANARPEEAGLTKADLTQLDGSEDDKIRAMMSQSTQDYDPSNYQKIRGANQVGEVPPNYRCYKCHQPGHWIKNCPLGNTPEPMEIKKSTGIPRSFMVPVDGPQVQGAMMTPNGQYAVPVLDHQAYTEGKLTTQAPVVEQKPDIPEDLVCSICSDLLTDAVMIPCCGNSFCDECIRSSLLDSEEHECPDCHEREISPGTLIPNRFLRTSVTNFLSATGYSKQRFYQRSNTIQDDIKTKPEPVVPVVVEKEEPKIEVSEKPVISEADSTEPKHTPEIEEPTSDEFKSSSEVSLPEGPPGVEQPEIESKGQAISSVASVTHRPHPPGSSRHERARHESSRARLPSQNIPTTNSTYNEPSSRLAEERPGTPTIDEPGNSIPPAQQSGYANMAPPDAYMSHGGAPPPNMMPHPGPPQSHQQPPMGMGGPPPPHMQIPPPAVGPPQSVPPQYQMAPVGPPPGGPSGGYGGPPVGPPPGNAAYRLPPPGHPDFMRQQPYQQPVRPGPPMFDNVRPPMSGPPPSGLVPPYGGGYPPRGPPRNNYGPPPPGRHAVPPTGGRSVNAPGIIDDPLEAFNRMLREKDERDRKAKMHRRSYSRSSSRSYSRSPRRRRSRSPVRRSRSRSFSISRSRSRSFSPSPRGSPMRDYSPRGSPPPRRRGHSRYRSPIRRSPPPPRYRYKDNPPAHAMDRSRGSDRDRGNDRDRDRGDRDYAPPQQQSYYDNMGNQGGGGYGGGYGDAGSGRDHRGGRGPPPSRNQYGLPRGKEFHSHGGGMQDAQPPPQTYYPPEQNYPPINRYPPRNTPHPQYPPSLLNMKTAPPVDIPVRRFEEVAPPGTEPTIPGFENPIRYDERYERNREEVVPPGVERYQGGDVTERERPAKEERTREDKEVREPRDRDYARNERPDNSDKREEKARSPRRNSTDRHKSPDKRHRRKRDNSSDREKEKRDGGKNDADKDKKERRKETSDDEKVKKSKDKKKKKERKEKKEEERKKRKEKKEKKEQEKLKKAEEKKIKEAAVAAAAQKDGAEVENPEEPTKKVEKSAPDAVKEQVAPAEETVVPPEVLEEPIPKSNVDLYEDMPECVDSRVVENYGKIDNKNDSLTSNEDRYSDRKSEREDSIKGDAKSEQDSDEEEEEEEDNEPFDGIELHSNDLDLKLIESKSSSTEVLAPLPEPSKWERDDEPSEKQADTKLSPDTKSDIKQVFDRPSKVVTSEVLKRAENAIFAKAINAIRPIEIKKISLDRVKLYSGEKKMDSLSPVEIVPVRELQPSSKEIKNFQITIPGGGYDDDDIHPPGTEPERRKVKTEKPAAVAAPSASSAASTPAASSANPPVRLSVKERLGCKVDDLDRIVKEDNKPFDRNRSKSLSPLSKRNDEGSRNFSDSERKDEMRGRHTGKYNKDDKRDYKREENKRDERKDDRRRAEDDRKKDDERKVEEPPSNPRDRRRGGEREEGREDRRRDDYRRIEFRDRRDERREEHGRRDYGRDDRKQMPMERRGGGGDFRSNSRRVERKEKSRSRGRRVDSKVAELKEDPRKREYPAADKNVKEEKKEDKKEERKRRRTKSRSFSKGQQSDKELQSEPKHGKKKDKKPKKEKHKHKKDDEDENVKFEGEQKETEKIKVVEEKLSRTTDRRKPTLDEANFEPDYDLESESEKDDEKMKKRDLSKSDDVESAKKRLKVEVLEAVAKEKRKERESSSSDSSDSSSEEDRKKRKHKKHRRKKSKRETSSSSSESESDSDDDEKEKKRRKHKSKKQKKKKKSKHK